jgi:hypothetical protein
MVAAGMAVLLLIPVLVAYWPVRAAADLDPAALRDRMVRSASVAYTGYAESSGTLALPDLPQTNDLAALLGETTRLRAWYAGPDRWRVDEVKATGETGTYAAVDHSWRWDYERDLLTVSHEQPPVRLPRAADLLPPDLARRLLRGLAADDKLEEAPARRVAGITAAGLRVTPADPGGTVGRLEVWADPETGLPLEVAITPVGYDVPVLRSRFLDLQLGRPSAVALERPEAANSGFSLTNPNDLISRVDAFAPFDLPGQLAGYPRNQPVQELAEVRGVGTYRQGLAAFTVVPLPPGVAGQFRSSLEEEGGELQISGAPGASAGTPLVNALVTVTPRGNGWLIAGTVEAAVLERAAATLLANPPVFRR